MKTKINPKFIFVTIAIFIAAASRLLPHPFNFTAITAMALFGGATFSDKRLAFVVPFASMLITDLIIGFHNTMWAVYLSFLIVTLIGFTLRKSDLKKSKIILASVISSTVFFLITNFAVWIDSGFYSRDFIGLTECYFAAIPFYENSVFGSFALNSYLGDLFFNGLLFGSLFVAHSKFPKLVQA